jgi:Na+/pantothenate symporter
MFWDIHHEFNKQAPHKRIFIGLIIVAIISAVTAVFIPSTDTVIKIIATKKGVDAIQSDTAVKYLSEADKAVTNGMKVLNQEIAKKLDKKEVSK